jgi:D-beta-D-heptose 7-phosphate kinase/D-beta-D-heptose 1-phosphate adenosyltransferase
VAKTEQRIVVPGGSAIADGTMARLIPLFVGRTVLVLGDVMLDRYVSGEVSRISPEAPIPVLRVNAARASLGGAANVAHSVAALGARAILLGVIGADDAGAELGRRFARAIDESDVVVLSDYAKGVLCDRLLRRVVNLSRKAGRPVIADPKRASFKAYRNVTVLTPNAQEVTRATGWMPRTTTAPSGPPECRSMPLPAMWCWSRVPNLA